MKKLFIFSIILILIGGWAGVNFAKNKPLFSNPFEDKRLAKKSKKILEKLLNDGIDRAKDLTKEQLNDLKK